MTLAIRQGSQKLLEKKNQREYIHNIIVGKNFIKASNVQEIPKAARTSVGLGSSLGPPRE